MRAAGIRDLKNRLSEYLRVVRGGEPVLVTDRGTVVAEIRQPGQGFVDSKIAPGLLELARAGKVRPGAANDPDLYPSFEPVLSRSEVLDLLDEERGER